MLELQLPANMPSISVSFCFCQKQQLTVFSLRIFYIFQMYKYSLGSVVGEINLERLYLLYSIQIGIMLYLTPSPELSIRS